MQKSTSSKVSPKVAGFAFTENNISVACKIYERIVDKLRTARFYNDLLRSKVREQVLVTKVN